MTEEILLTPFPDKFKFPALTYDGTTDPEDHISTYEGMMQCYDCNSAHMCRAFKTTLRGNARKWYYSIKKGSIKSWSQLAEAFHNNYLGASDPSQLVTELLRVKQGRDESLRGYVTRFTAEKVKIINCHDQGATMAFFAVLRDYSSFKFSIKNEDLVIIKTS